MPTMFNTEFTVYRGDLNHSTVSGNKLHKLAPHIDYAVAQQVPEIVSFGGAYSNHLHALAWICKQHGLTCNAYVRGELQDTLTPTLRDCVDWGMQLKPLNRKRYRQCLEKLESLHTEPLFGRVLKDYLADDIETEALVIPEGGSSISAIESLASAYSKVFEQAEFKNVSHAFCATGTGATVAGLALAAPPSVKVVGIQAVAEGDATRRRIESWIDTASERIEIIEGHFGGFAKTPPALINFINDFEIRFSIPLDPTYNGKVFYTLAHLAQTGFFSPEDRALVIHTGGLQGKRGLKQQTHNKIGQP